MKRRGLTLAVIHQDGKILLGMKKRGYAEGVWNGYGGKIDQGETPEEAMRREFWEESGAKAGKCEKIGHIEFTSDVEDYLSECHVYKIHDYVGEIIETEEMSPQWFDFTEIPYDNMWPDDIHWLPLILQGKKIRGNFSLKNNDSIESFDIIEVESF